MIWPVLALDVICILVFAAVGRSSHAEAADLLGVLRTAWPFLVGWLVGVLVGRTWRRPASLAAAAYVLVATVVLGMILRVLTGAGTQLSFIIVTTIVLGVLFSGWRGLIRLARRSRERRTERVGRPTG